MKTGSTDAFSTGIQLSSKTRSEVDALSASILAGVEKGSWYVNPSASYALSSAQPSIMSDGNLLFKGRYTLDFGTEAVAEGKIQPVVARRALLLSLLSRPRMRWCLMRRPPLLRLLLLLLRRVLLLR